MTDGSPPPSRLRALAGHPVLAAAGAFAACFLVMCAISWPMPLYLEDWHLFTMFGDLMERT